MLCFSEYSRHYPAGMMTLETQGLHISKRQWMGLGLLPLA